MTPVSDSCLLSLCCWFLLLQGITSYPLASAEVMKSDWVSFWQAGLERASTGASLHSGKLQNPAVHHTPIRPEQGCTSTESCSTHGGMLLTSIAHVLIAATALSIPFALMDGASLPDACMLCLSLFFVDTKSSPTHCRHAIRMASHAHVLGFPGSHGRRRAHLNQLPQP